MKVTLDVIVLSVNKLKNNLNMCESFSLRHSMQYNLAKNSSFILILPNTVVNFQSWSV